MSPLLWSLKVPTTWSYCALSVASFTLELELYGSWLFRLIARLRAQMILKLPILRPSLLQSHCGDFYCRWAPNSRIRISFYLALPCLARQINSETRLIKQPLMRKCTTSGPSFTAKPMHAADLQYVAPSEVFSATLLVAARVPSEQRSAPES